MLVLFKECVLFCTLDHHYTMFIEALMLYGKIHEAADAALRKYLKQLYFHTKTLQVSLYFPFSIEIINDCASPTC